MKSLILIRHAKSSWSDPDLADIDRPLNARGKRDAPAMGERLARRGIEPDGFVASPAKRARKTARAIAGAIGFPNGAIEWDARVYEASAMGLMDLVAGFDDAFDRIALVGHNPAMTELANLLGAGGIDNVPTCGIVEIEFPIHRWRDLPSTPGVLTCFDYPKKPGEGVSP